MKTKAIAAIMVTMLIVGMVFYVLPVKAQTGVIKIGVIGPDPWPQYTGMVEGATLAASWINDTGPGGGDGIMIGGTKYFVELEFGNEHAVGPDPDAGKAEMKRLITDEQCDFVLGGFRTECTSALIEEAMLWDQIYFICGSSTNALIDATVRNDYSKYKYLFRVTPINGTMLVYNILGFLTYYALPSRLAPLYGVQLDGDPPLDIKTAILAEDLDWTIDLWNAFIYGGYLGPQANIVYSARTPYPCPASTFLAHLDAMHAAEVRLVIQIYSGPDSLTLIPMMAAHPLKAVACGIDVVSQTTEIWSATAGAVKYESFLHSTGTRSPISAVSKPWNTTTIWDKYYAAFGHAPLYTMWGVYDGIISLHDTLEAMGTLAPPFNQNSGGRADALIPIIEQTDYTMRDHPEMTKRARNGSLGKFQYTGYGPHAGLSAADYATHTITVGPNATKTYYEVNPNMKGVLHDVYSFEFMSTWPVGYVRSHWTQWQGTIGSPLPSGRHEVIHPSEVAFAKRWALPDETGKMYPYPEDVLQDGGVDVFDALTMRAAAGTKSQPPDQPADPMWQFVADVNPDNIINMPDLSLLKLKFGQTVALPLTYGNEAGQMS